MTATLATTTIQLPSDLRIATKDGTLTYPWHQFFDQLRNISSVPVSVKDFGAKGDGTTNDTVAIQAALDSGACEVYVPCGTYNCGQLTIPTSVTFFHGPGTLQANVASTDVLVSDSNFGLVIEGLTILGSGVVTGAGIHIKSCVGGVIRNCSVSGTSSAINLLSCQHFAVSNNIILGYKDYGILATSCSVLWVDRNDVKPFNVVGGTGSGVRILLGTDIHVTNNTVDRPPIFGIQCGGIAKLVVNSNTVRGNLYEGIQVSANASPATELHDFVVSNNVVSFADYNASIDIGMDVVAEGANCYQGVVANNVITFPGSNGIWLGTVTTGSVFKVVVTGNQVSNPGHNSAAGGVFRSGINLFANCSDILVTGNQVRDDVGLMEYAFYEAAASNNNNNSFYGNYANAGVSGKYFISGASTIVQDDPRSTNYTVTTLPSPTVTGQTIFVSNEAGGAVLAFSDGANWRRVTDRAIVS